MIKIDWFGDSHIGKIRQSNQDYYIGCSKEGVWIVCDGMGGHDYGDIASRMAAEKIIALAKDGDDLTEAVIKAHHTIQKIVPNGPPHSHPGTTVIVLRSDTKNYEVVWVGDSRAWLWNGDKLRQLTLDHTPVQEMVNNGKLSLEKAKKHPHRHHLSQVLGMAGIINPGQVKNSWDPRQQALLLTTDGVICHDDPESACQLLAKAKNPREAVAALINESINAGGFDNITVIAIGWPESRNNNKI